MGNHVVRWRYRVLADFAVDNQRHAAARFLGLLLLLQRLHPAAGIPVRRDVGYR